MKNKNTAFFMWVGRRVALCAIPLLLALPAQAQNNFSCRYGTQPSCLDYGAQVCSSTGKCVDSNAACFDTYQCNYEGFTCKSAVTEVVDQHDALVRKYNTLLSDNDDLVRKYNELLSDNNELVDKFNDLLAEAKKVAKSHDEVKTCLLYASTLDEAQNCGLY